MTSGKPPASAQFRRKIFYLAGFDPRGARLYHAMLEEEAARANGSGAAITVTPRRRSGGDAVCEVISDSPEGACHTEYVFLAWDDIVRRNWPSRPLAVLRQATRAYAGFTLRFNWPLARRAPVGSRKTLFYPGINLLAMPPLTCLVVFMIARLILWHQPWWLALLIALAVTVAGAVVRLRALPSMWLLRFVIFNDSLARHPPDDELDQRLDRFAARISAALAAEDADEVLLVTHSNGSILGIPLMLRLRDRAGGAMPGRFGFVTLGGCVQLLAARKDALWFHGLLDRLATGGFAWLDIGSLTDGACVPLIPPLLGRTVETPPGFTQLSPRWFRYADPAAHAARRKDKQATHFDYLRRLARPSPLDYVALITAARPLAASIEAFRAENA